MAFRKNWSRWWHRFLGIASETPQVIDLLRQRYVEEMQRIESFEQHAEKMHYPQYREKLLRMAQENGQVAEQIGEKIVALGARLPMWRIGARRTKTTGNLCRWRLTKRTARPVAYLSNSGILHRRTRTLLNFCSRFPESKTIIAEKSGAC